MLQLTGHADALALTVIVGVIYLAVVRFLDLNEKEPLWAIGLLFLIGAVVAFFLNLVVDSAVLELKVFEGAMAAEIARFRGATRLSRGGADRGDRGGRRVPDPRLRRLDGGLAGARAPLACVAAAGGVRGRRGDVCAIARKAGDRAAVSR